MDADVSCEVDNLYGTATSQRDKRGLRNCDRCIIPKVNFSGPRLPCQRRPMLGFHHALQLIYAGALDAGAFADGCAGT